MYMKEFYMYVQLFLLSVWLFLPVSRRINHQKFLHVGVQPFLSLHGRQHLTPLSEGSVVSHHHVPLHHAATLRCPFCWQHLLQARKIQKRKVLHTRHTKLVCCFMFLFEKNYEYCPWKGKKKYINKKKPTTVGVTLSLSFGGQTASLVAGDPSCCWPLLQGRGLTLFEFSNHEDRAMGKRHPSHLA